MKLNARLKSASRRETKRARFWTLSTLARQEGLEAKISHTGTFKCTHQTLSFYAHVV